LNSLRTEFHRLFRVHEDRTDTSKRVTFVRPNDLVERKMPKETLCPRHIYSYPGLIGLALKNSSNGLMYISDIFKFMSVNFPYYRKSTERWQYYIRQNLNEKTLFLTIDQEPTNNQFDLESPFQTNLMWRVNPSKVYEVDPGANNLGAKGPNYTNV